MHTRVECRCIGDCAERKLELDKVFEERAAKEKQTRIDDAARLLRNEGWEVTPPVVAETAGAS